MAKAKSKAGKPTAGAVEEPDDLTTVGDAGTVIEDEGDGDEENEYELLEAGTIVKDVMYPLMDTEETKYEESERMIVKLTHQQAQKLQLGGIPLRRRQEE